MLHNLISADGRKEWRAHWPVVAVAMSGFAIAHSHLYSIGVMVEPLEKEFQWSRVQISSGLLIVSLVVSPFAPFLGMLVDRFGPRRIALFGMLLYGSAMAMLALAQQAIWTWWLLWTLLAFGHLCLNPTIWIAAVSSLFVASRGLALAIAMCASGAMALGGPLLTYFFVQSFGWRMAYVMWGGVAIALVLPLIYFFFSSLHDKTRVAPTKQVHHRISGPQMSLRDTLLSPSFMKMAFAALIMSHASMALMVNLVPILSSSRLDLETAAFVAGLMGISQVLGRIGCGFMLDKFNARVVAAFVVLLPVLTAIILLFSGPSVFLAIVAVLIFGLSLGAEMDIIAYLAARFFGIRIFGTVFGIIVSLLVIGTGLGPVLGSLVYDLTGNYQIVLWAVIPLSLLSSVLLLKLGPYPQGENGPHEHTVVSH